MKKNWNLAETISKELIEKHKELSPILVQLLVNRKIDESEFEDFLNEDNNKLLDPFLFKDMEKAVNKVIYHIKSQSKIIIYGDYDADGITSTALLFNVLKTLKAQVDTYIPDRASEGYSLNEQAVREFASQGIKLIITVDNGTRNKKEIALANKLGLEVIVTDHHIFPKDKKDWSECLIINPANPEDNYPYKKLAGVGVAFKLASALVSRAKLSEANKEKIIERQLDLVTIGTIADLVPLTGENRILVRIGLKAMNKGLDYLNKSRAGLEQLVRIAGVSKELEVWNISFQLAPRLNASSRLEHADTAVNLLTTSDKQEARLLAKELDGRNQKRQKITEEIYRDVEELLLNNTDKIKIVVCPKGKHWNEGVIGLVASKVNNKYYLPTLIITRTKEKDGSLSFKGSGRSIKEFNLVEALEKFKNNLDKYGGHPLACGLSIYNEEKLGDFIKEITEYANNKLGDKKLEPKIDIDAVINLEQLDNELVDICNKLRPYGQNNHRPVFVSLNEKIDDIITMGDKNQHLKLKLNNFFALAFGQSEKYKDLKVGNNIDIVFYPEIKLTKKEISKARFIKTQFFEI